MPPEPDFSLVHIAVMMLTVAIGPEFAEAGGVYFVILFGWFGGVIWGAFRLPRSHMRLSLFVLMTLVFTLGLTVPLAQLLAASVPKAYPALEFTMKGLLFPVAAAIPAVGHSWPTVIMRAWGFVWRFKQPKAEQ